MIDVSLLHHSLLLLLQLEFLLFSSLYYQSLYSLYTYTAKYYTTMSTQNLVSPLLHSL